MQQEQNANPCGASNKHNSLMLIYIVMGLLTAILAGTAYVIAPERFIPEIDKSSMFIFEALPVVVISIFAATVLAAFLSPQFIARWAGAESGVKGIFFATGAGTLISCEPVMGLPLVLGIARGGAGIGFIVALLTSSKLFSFMRIPDYFVFLDLKLAVFFLCSTLAMPFLAGVLANFVADNFSVNTNMFAREKGEEVQLPQKEMEKS